MNRILNRVYAERSAKRGREKLAEDLKSLHADLAQWRKELPSHLTFDPSDTSSVVPPPHVLSLLYVTPVLPGPLRVAKLRSLWQSHGECSPNLAASTLRLGWASSLKTIFHSGQLIPCLRDRGNGDNTDPSSLRQGVFHYESTISYILRHIRKRYYPRPNSRPKGGWFRSPRVFGNMPKCVQREPRNELGRETS